MARSPRQPENPFARAGLWAVVLAPLVFLFGDFSRQNVMEWLRILLIAGSIALVFRWTVTEPYKIPSNSMHPTLNGDPRFLRGDRVFINKWRYGLRYPLNNVKVPILGFQVHYADGRLLEGRKPQRWEIAVFFSPDPDDAGKVLIKRIVGLPGETVLIRDGRLHIDGEPLDLPPGMPDIGYSTGTTMNPGRYGVIPTEEYTRVPEGHYFMLGDNTDASRDGRYWGWVPNEHLLGRAYCIAWPPARIRDFTGFSETWWWRALVVLAGASLVWRLFIGRTLKLKGPPPDQAVREGQRVYVNRAAFGIPLPFTRNRLTRGREPRRGELVAYRPPGASGEDVLVGRVAGLPGEQVRLVDGALTVNGQRVEDGPLASRRYDETAETGPYGTAKGKQHRQVPDAHYFLLADDAEAHPDGRSLGWTPRQALIGPVTGTVLPPKSLRD